MTCLWCGAPTKPGKRGPAPKYCSTRHRVAAFRARGLLPAELTDRPTWTRRAGKRPVRVDGSPASSTDPATWSPWAHVAAGGVGDGFGIMLGDGLGCWDLDHCFAGDELLPWAAELLASIDHPLWIERSMSGDGLHVFVRAEEAPGWRRGHVEFYSRARFIAVTGNAFAA